MRVLYTGLGSQEGRIREAEKNYSHPARVCVCEFHVLVLTIFLFFPVPTRGSPCRRIDIHLLAQRLPLVLEDQFTSLTQLHVNLLAERDMRMDFDAVQDILHDVACDLPIDFLLWTWSMAERCEDGVSKCG